jgi:hypothetical protein
MNDQDMLIKQLLGRYSDNELRVRTVLTDVVVAQHALAPEDMNKIVKTNAIAQLCAEIVENHELRDVVTKQEADTYGKTVTISTYCFSRMGIISLITNAFNAGVESKKGSDRD